MVYNSARTGIFIGKLLRRVPWREQKMVPYHLIFCRSVWLSLCWRNGENQGRRCCCNIVYLLAIVFSHLYLSRAESTTSCFHLVLMPFWLQKKERAKSLRTSHKQIPSEMMWYNYREKGNFPQSFVISWVSPTSPVQTITFVRRMRETRYSCLAEGREQTEQQTKMLLYRVYLCR